MIQCVINVVILDMIYHAITTCTAVLFFKGIFAYLNYLTPQAREEIINILLTGLQRLEYRGYDSAGYHYSVIAMSYGVLTYCLHYL